MATYRVRRLGSWSYHSFFHWILHCEIWSGWRRKLGPGQVWKTPITWKHLNAFCICCRTNYLQSPASLQFWTVTSSYWLTLQLSFNASRSLEPRSSDESWSSSAHRLTILALDIQIFQREIVPPTEKLQTSSSSWALCWSFRRVY